MNAATESSAPIACADTTPRDRRNQYRFLGAIFVWAVIFVAASFVLKRELLAPGPAAWLLAALPIAIGVAVVLAFARYLSQADELQRVIQLQALALGFGAGWVAMSGYPLLVELGAPAFDPGDYTLVMIVFYVIGYLHGLRRYR